MPRKRHSHGGKIHEDTQMRPSENKATSRFHRTRVVPHSGVATLHRRVRIPPPPRKTKFVFRPSLSAAGCRGNATHMEGKSTMTPRWGHRRTKPLQDFIGPEWC